MKIKLQYFAQFRDLAGTNEQELETACTTARELYQDIKARYKFPLAEDHVLVAINDDYSTFDTTLAEGDTVVFIPPVSGG